MEQVSLQRSARAAGQGRSFVAGFCARHAVPEPVAADAVLIVSELVTNAYLHAGSGAQVCAGWNGGLLRVEVADDSAAVPRALPASMGATSGRGMMITKALASRWGTSPAGTGKVVWFEVDAPA